MAQIGQAPTAVKVEGPGKSCPGICSSSSHLSALEEEQCTSRDALPAETMSASETEVETQCPMSDGVEHILADVGGFVQHFLADGVCKDDEAFNLTSPAVAMAFVCTSCLQAHLGSQPPVLLRYALSDIGTSEEFEQELLAVLAEACSEPTTSECHAVTSPDAEQDDALAAIALASRETSCKQQHDDNACPSKGRDSAHEAALGVINVGKEHTAAHEVPPSTAAAAPGQRSTPPFLLQLDAGWVLASAVWECVALLERAKDYVRAVELLVQLLATR